MKKTLIRAYFFQKNKKDVNETILGYFLKRAYNSIQPYLFGLDAWGSRPRPHEAGFTRASNPGSEGLNMSLTQFGLADLSSGKMALSVEPRQVRKEATVGS